MSWICPNCSNANDDDESSCFVCGMERSAALVSSASSASAGDEEKYQIVFSGFQAFKESLKRLFRRKPRKAAAPEPDEPPEDEPPRKPKKPKTAEKKRPAALIASEEEETAGTEAGPVGGDPSPAPGFAAPWPEHRIEFIIPAIRAKGFVRSEQYVMDGVKGYRFYGADGSCRFLRHEVILIQKMARRV